MRRLVAALIPFAALALTIVPTGAALADEAASVARGKQLYYGLCIYCHGPGVWGTNKLAKRFDKEHAQLESRTDLTAEGIKAVVRNGLGSMPPIRRTEVSDANLDAIVAYLTRKEHP